MQSPPVCLGLARRAIEEFKQLAVNKQSAFGGPRLSEQVRAQAGLARAEGLVRSVRTYWYESVETLWEAALMERELSLAERAAVRIASVTAAENSVAAADLLYRLAGTTAIFQSSPLERCWRDLHTAAQHMAVRDSRWETAGRVLFGLDPKAFWAKPRLTSVLRPIQSSEETSAWRNKGNRLMNFGVLETGDSLHEI